MITTKICRKWNKLKCLDCGHIFDMSKGMISFCKTWIFYCPKCDSTNVDIVFRKKGGGEKC